MSLYWPRGPAPEGGAMSRMRRFAIGCVIFGTVISATATVAFLIDPHHTPPPFSAPAMVVIWIVVLRTRRRRGGPRG